MFAYLSHHSHVSTPSLQPPQPSAHATHSWVAGSIVYAPMHSRQAVVELQLPQLAAQLQVGANGGWVHGGQSTQEDADGERQAR